MAEESKVSPKAQPKVSIVVLNWNGKRFVDPFMQSFLALDYPKEKLELVFTDNGSSDDSLAYFEQKYAGQPNIKVVKNGRNYGYAGGNNRGMHHTSGDYIMICNNDIVLTKNSLTELVKVATHTKADAVVPKLMYQNKKDIINNAGSRIDEASDWPIYEIAKDQKDTGQLKDIYEVSALCGASMLLRRDFLQTIGLFDNKFFLYFEDGDLSWRGQKASRHYFVAPSSVVYHAHTGSSQEGSKVFNYYVGRNRLLILTKNGHLSPLAKAWAKTLRDQFFWRIKNLVVSLFGNYSKKAALSELWQGLRILVGAAWLTPYALAKRWHLIREETL